MPVDSHQGDLFVFNDNPWKKLVAFRVGDSPKCAILIGGQQDGFFALNYIDKLTEDLVGQGWCVIQALFGSWYAGYGRAVLENDKEDLDALLRYCMQNFNAEEFALFGFHTGAQDAVFYLQEGQYKDKVSHLILQGGMRNPTEFGDDNTETQEMHRELAQTMVEQGRGNCLMPEAVHPRPISAFRFLAMDMNQGIQDFFNPRLSADEMAQVVGHVEIPTLVLFCMDDNYHLIHDEKMTLFDKVQLAIAGDVSIEYVDGGCDEWLNFLKGSEKRLSDRVVQFLLNEGMKRAEKEEEARKANEAEAKRGRSLVHKKSGLKRSVSQSSLGSTTFSQGSQG
eukprot:TRINITY_DN93651_c0_g1_i1.p1 TRINITY_DN93651_c0_g1~~TRINITY_DN93651_c0_g1_i1.p1  ORF type:complete len:337 (+),score=44.15 TRINITY_DN93651_c0_g1_i1:41-1051(+)